MEIYLLIDGHQTGPYSQDEVCSRLKSKTIGPSTLAWHNGITEWHPVSDVITSCEQGAGKARIMFEKQIEDQFESTSDFLPAQRRRPMTPEMAKKLEDRYRKLLDDSDYGESTSEIITTTGPPPLPTKKVPKQQPDKSRESHTNFSWLIYLFLNPLTVIFVIAIFTTTGNERSEIIAFGAWGIGFLLLYSFIAIPIESKWPSKSQIKLGRFGEMPSKLVFLFFALILPYCVAAVVLANIFNHLSGGG